MTKSYTFFKRVPANILIELRKCGNTRKNNHQMSRIVDCTYSGYLKIVNDFKRMNLLKRKKIGRNSISTLTKKGKIIADYIMFIIGKTNEK